MTLDMALTFYTSVAKGLKLKVRKFRRLIPMFEFTGEKLVGRGGGAFSFLNRVDVTIFNRAKIIGILGLFEKMSTHRSQKKV